MGRKWVGYGIIPQGENPRDLKTVRDIQSEPMKRAIEFYITPGDQVVKLSMEETDSKSDFMGWLDAEGNQTGYPVMIQRTQIFDIQFAYGYRASEDRGQGKAIYLKISIV